METKERNFKTGLELKKEVYLDVHHIEAYLQTWEEFDEVKEKWVKKRNIVCTLNSPILTYSPLNLGECNDGSKFTAVNQAVNQAKEMVNIILSWNRKTN